MAAGVTVTVTMSPGLKAVLAKLSTPAKYVAVALYQEAEEVMGKSKEAYVPVDQGTLRGTGHVQPPEIHGGRVWVELGYGGPAAPYALVQHEHLGYRHTVGRAKYLEQAVLDSVPGMSDRLAASILRAVGA